MNSSPRVDHRGAWRRGVLAALGVSAVVAGVALGAGGAGGGTRAGGASVTGANEQFQKAKALYDAGKYQEAWVENQKALQMDPQNGNAVLLRSILQSRIGEGGGEAVTSGPAAAGGGTGGVTGGPAGRMKTLTPQQISTIKLMEMSRDDTTIRGRVDAQGLEDFWNEVVKADTTADVSKPAHDAFVRPTNFIVQARRIKDSGNMKFIPQVMINNDPAVMMPYKTNVNTYVAQNCATSECHGGDKAGNFRLISASAGNSDANVYTNFYILSTYANKAGRMLDRDTPEMSLLVQYSLPKNLAKIPHPGPDVKRIASTSDQRYRNYAEWVKSLAFPRPNYGFTLGLPGGATPAASTSAPATGPATATRPK